ncbi:MAG: T9SS type A sorting domain-containing protein [Saprospiraceae bacterium]|nr:T9SS type A sorting domain-containing protein [Saprospiraceae bacterium]
MELPQDSSHEKRASQPNRNGLSSLAFLTQELKFFPNPVTDLLTISSNESLTSFSIWNSLGNLIYTLTPSQALQRCALDFSIYPRGVYFIKVDGKDKLQTTVFTVLKE